MGQTTTNKKSTVLDLSCYNPSDKSKKIDYKKVKAAGIKHVILKAISVSLVADRRFEEHMKGCADAGINVFATYHYSYAKNEAAAGNAADAWIKVVAGRCNEYVLDWEDNSLPKDETAIKIIKVYADKITAAGGKFILYVGLAWFNSYLKKYRDKLPYRLWVARYYAGYKTFNIDDIVNDKYIPAVSGNLVGWQYTSSGNVPGIAGSVDMSIWYEDIITADDKSQVAAPMRVDINPYTVPTQTVKLGTTGNDANWVLWYLWRFGLLLDDEGQADSTRINGMIEERDLAAIIKSQEILHTTPDAKVGKITRGLYMKIC